MSMQDKTYCGFACGVVCFGGIICYALELHMTARNAHHDESEFGER
jgi:hypothetical protein